ncbi:TetR/AcrR family transcriptional regulator [Levilactobacillus cerevisiae]|uniref:TetR/AcrR family transcriptional regulator n=1 Tax=Levilactobacillus cerevisiae TaxID=1704076 RepID=UPI000F774598|nr:TetR-like C-terminal domain-containing protein [Levilactobacillus cerevisiae]
MNTAHNQRAQETEAHIKSVFLSMLAQRTVQQSMNVKQLCVHAHINRSTFYVHYKDIYDLAEKIQLDQQAQVIQLLDHSLAVAPDNLAFVMTRLFEFVYKNRYFYQVYLQRHSGILLFDSTEFQKFMTKIAVPLPHNPVQRRYRMAFLTAGVGAMMRQWLKDDCQETPVEMAQLVDLAYR